MQTCKHNLRGGNRKFGFMSIVTNPQVSSNEHTHCNGQFSLNVSSPVGKKSPNRSSFHLSVASVFVFFLFYIRLFTLEFLGSFYSLCILRSSHSDGESLAHLLPNDFLTAVWTLPVVSRQRPSEPQQVPANTKPHRSAAGSQPL